MRQFLFVAGPLLIPTLLYLAWFAASVRRAEAAGSEPPKLGDAPWTWLIGAGVGLVAIALSGLALLGGAPPGTPYLPPRVIDGVVVPAGPAR